MNAPGGAQTIFAGGGRIYDFNAISTAPQVVVAINNGRTRITFHNPGTVDLFVAPTVVQNGGSDSPLVPTTSLLGGCLRIYGNGGTTVVEGSSAQRSWQAFAVSGTTNPLTVLDDVV